MSSAVMILSFFLTSLGVYYVWRRRKIYLLSYKLNGPLAYPIIGNGTHFIGDTTDLVQRLMDLSQIYGKPMRVWFGGSLVVYISHPKQIEKILTSSKMAYKNELYRMLQIFIGDGLVSNLGGEKYRMHKKLIQPLLSLKFICESINVFQKHIDKLTNILKKYEGGGTFDVFKDIHRCLADIIGECILGVNIRALDGENKEYLDAALRMYTAGYERVSKPWLNNDFLFSLTPRKKVQDHIQNTTFGFVQKAIIKSRQRVVKNENQNSDTTPIIDNLSQIINENPGVISEVDFVHHMLTLYAASEDTMALITSMLCVCMGMYPEYQKRVVSEIQEVVGETPIKLEPGMLYKMKYLDMCIRDVLRLMPIAPLIFRQATEDFEIDNCAIPKGVSCCISIYEVHRNREHWENPQHFHPDHFLPETVKKRPMYAFVPFSAGGRGCIGKQMVLVGIKVIMISILQQFEIEADGKFPDIKLKNDITIRSANGYKIRLKKRAWN